MVRGPVRGAPGLVLTGPLGPWRDVSGGDCVVVSGRVSAAGDLAAVTSRMAADCYREGDTDIDLHFERTIARVNHT